MADIGLDRSNHACMLTLCTCSYHCSQGLCLYSIPQLKACPMQFHIIYICRIHSSFAIGFAQQRFLCSLTCCDDPFIVPIVIDGYTMNECIDTISRVQVSKPLEHNHSCPLSTYKAIGTGIERFAPTI